MEVKAFLDEYGGFAAMALAIASLALMAVPGVELAGGFMALFALVVLLALLLWD